MNNNNDVTFLVSFTVTGDDPRTILAQELVKITNENIYDVEIVDDTEFDFIGGLEDDYNFFEDIDMEG